MQQRVGLARALAADPDVLMFDEPFSALDPLIRRDMQNEVIRLHHEVGKTMVFITHDLAEALKLGDRILIMRDGEIVQIGTPDEVVGAAGRRLRARLRQRRAPVARAHPEVGDARAERRRALDGPVLPVDQIVRDAARVVLDHHGPCRVADGDRIVGVVDDEDILRVVVAEEDATCMTTTTLPPGGPPTADRAAARRSSRSSSTARSATPASSCSASSSSGWSLWALLKGKNTMALGFQDTTDLHRWLNEARDWVQLEGQDNWFFGGVLGGIGDFLNSVVEFLQELIGIPALAAPGPGDRLARRRRAGGLGRPTSSPASGPRSWSPSRCCRSACFGLWADSMDTLIITLRRPWSSASLDRASRSASGWPAARRVSAVVTPVLDVMQTMPAFCYLAPLALFFGIGPAAAVVLTFIYALPPLVRITEHGIRSVSDDHGRGGPVDGPDQGPDAAPGAAADGPAHHRRRHQPVHDGGAVDGDHRRPGQRARPRQARRRRAADPERRRGLGRRPGDRAHGDHARPHHHRRQRALEPAAADVGLGERARRHARPASCSSSCRAGRPRTPARASAARG